ncbi:unnamed protein product [Amaranthus hypochondriacus]
MKGHPGTGKSTVATAIATTFRIPLIDKDDIRDATLSISSNATPTDLNHLSYAVMWRVVSTQVRLGLSVVIDSPLSHRSHLDDVLRIAAGTHRVFIVECRPSDQIEWRHRLEKRGAGDVSGHKPATWQDMERLLEDYNGCTEYDVRDIPRLIVDTTPANGTEFDHVANVTQFILSNSQS